MSPHGKVTGQETVVQGGGRGGELWEQDCPSPSALFSDVSTVLLVCGKHIQNFIAAILPPLLT